MLQRNVINLIKYVKSPPKQTRNINTIKPSKLNPFGTEELVQFRQVLGLLRVWFRQASL